MLKFANPRVLAGAALAAFAIAGAAKPTHAAELIYGFDDASLNGFGGARAIASLSTSTGVTQGAGAMKILEKVSSIGTGGALTFTVPTDLINASSFNIDVTIPTTPSANGSTSSFELYPEYFDTVDTDGPIAPDMSAAGAVINLTGVAPGTYTYTVNLNDFVDPEGVLPTDATVPAILAADGVNNPGDSISSFELLVVNKTGASTTLYVDNLTVPTIAVPEPGSVAAVCLGGLAIVGRRRRRA